ncbi:unnamed protein product, partial [Effrenium voratum]
MKENYPLKDDQSLEEAGLETGAALNAVIESEPRLYLVKPCSALEYGQERLDEWMAGEDHMVTSSRMHLDMESAPEVARQVAKDLLEAAPGLADITIARSSEGDCPSEVVVIGCPGEDPKKACLKALTIDKDSCEEFADAKDDEDPELTGVWTLATLEQVDWKDYLEFGFNGDKSDFNGDLNAMMDDLGVEKEEMDQLLKMTKIMSEKLERGFIFNFNDSAVVAPMVYGGYASDGSIVGVISYSDEARTDRIVASGKGKFEEEGRSDGLILSNVPQEYNTLDALNRHFRQFGEVLKITSQLSE